MLAAREGGADADEAADGGEHGEHGERNPHRGRRLVRKDGAVRVRAVSGWLVRVVVVVHVVASRVHGLRFADGLCFEHVRDADTLFGAVVRSVCDRRVNGDMHGLALVVCGGVRLVRLAPGAHFEESFLAPEGQGHQARHVEGRAGRGDCGDEPEQPAVRDVLCRGRVPEYLVLRPEARERDDAADGEPAREERPVGLRHVLPEAAHPTHVLLVVHGVDDRACAEEHQSLEEGVRHHVEDADDESADAAGEEHEAELRDRGVGQNLLDVVLRDADGRGEQGRQRADDCHDEHHRLRVLEDDVRARQHVEAGGDHRRRVDERRDRGRAGHRVGQPDVQGYLGGLAASADEEAERDPGHDAPLPDQLKGIGARLLHDRGVLRRAEGGDDAEDGEREAEVADAVRDEGFP